MTIEGRRPVWEALRAGRPIDVIWVARGQRRGLIGEILAFARQAGVPVQEVSPEALAARASTPSPQGVIARLAAVRPVPFEALLDRCKTAPGEAADPMRAPLLVFLDGLQDPGNVGSIIRTAEAAGAWGVVMRTRRAAGLTAAVAKASAGAIEHVPISQVINLARAIEAAKQAGLWIVGADQSAKGLLWEAALGGPLAIVVGSEGRGLSWLVRERCDLLVRIPMHGQIASLNAAIAAALLLYEVRRQRWDASRR